MRSEETPDRRLHDALRLACLACLALGVGLCVWGLTPIVVMRLVSHSVPPWGVLATSGLTLLTGAAYVGLARLARRGVGWALRVTLCASVFLLAGTFGMVLLSKTREIPLFPTLLTTSAVLTSWLAIVTQGAAERAVKPRQACPARAEEPRAAARPSTPNAHSSAETPAQTRV